MPLLPVQEDCLASAEQCYSVARLVALQLSVIQQSKQVINLDARGVLKQMEELPFPEVRQTNMIVRSYIMYNVTVLNNKARRLRT